MNIGILTLPLHTNYGGILQCYALSQILKQKGHHVCILDQKVKFYQPYPLKLLKQIKQYFLNFTHTYPTKVISAIITQNIDQFIEKQIPDKISFYTKRKLKNFNLDCIIIGSDQIWRGNTFYSVKDAYLCYSKGWEIKRMAYAASFGLDSIDYNEDEIRCCTDILNEYEGVSIREKSGIKICEQHLNHKAKLVIDPTLLLTKADYEKLITNEVTTKSEALYFYLLNYNEDKMKAVNIAANILDFNSFTFFNRYFRDKSQPIEKRKLASVEEWLSGFRDSNFVITDSFHGTVFSILFNKPFIVYGSKVGGLTRFQTILSLFDLEERYVSDSSQITQELISKPIDWDRVNRRIAHLREESLVYLFNTLHK